MIAIRRLLSVALLAVVGASCGGGMSAADRGVVERFAKAIKDISFEGGRLLQQDIKPRITELRDGGVTPEQFGREADNWIRGYQDLRDRVAKLERIPALDEAVEKYDTAFATYVEAFRAFFAASRLDTQQKRNDAITAAVPTAERADSLFDEARDELKRVMRAAGLDPGIL